MWRLNAWSNKTDEPRERARLGEVVRRVAHRLHSADNDDVGAASQDGLRAVGGRSIDPTADERTGWLRKRVHCSRAPAPPR